MEKVKLILSVIAICLGLGGTLTSCSENDDEPAVGAAKQIAGTYVGDITCSGLTWFPFRHSVEMVTTRYHLLMSLR